MTSTWDLYNRSSHGDLGVGKRPDELPRPDPAPFDMTTKEAAAMLGGGPNTMLDWCRKGKIASERHGYRYVLRRTDVRRLAAER